MEIRTREPAVGRASVDDQRDGALIHEVDRHHRTELPGFDGEPVTAQLGDQQLVERHRDIRAGGVDKRGTTAPLHVTVERELRHHKHARADVRQRSVHLAVIVREYSQAMDLLGHPMHSGVVVGVGEALEHRKATSNLPHHRSLDRHSCA